MSRLETLLSRVGGATWRGVPFTLVRRDANGRADVGVMPQPYAIMMRSDNQNVSDSSVTRMAWSTGGVSELSGVTYTGSPDFMLTVPAGLWSFSLLGQFATNTTGVRRFGIRSTDVGYLAYQSVNAAAGAQRLSCSVACVRLAQDTEVWAECYQTSGGTLALTASSLLFTAYRLGA